MRLREWQRQFQRVVLAQAPIDDLPLQQPLLAPALSMEIYAGAYRERLHEALRDNFPALHALLGDDGFAEMAYAFIARHPPNTASIRWFGAELPNYLRVIDPFAGLPVVGELAQFEWALRHAIDAGDAIRIGADDLKRLSETQWSEFTCAPHPSLSILRFDWNAPQVWRALDADEEVPPPAPSASCWFVYRSADLMIEWRSADSCEAQAIRWWSQGKNFAAICELLAENMGDAQAAIVMAAAFMRTWIEQGLLVQTLPREKNHGLSH